MVINSDYENVEFVDEDTEWRFTQPKNIQTKLTIKQTLGLSILLSIFFTPFLGPVMALIIKGIYDGKKDETLTKKELDKWANQKYCFKCGIIWEEALDISNSHR
jgi:hypothetical protein